MAVCAVAVNPRAAKDGGWVIGGTLVLSYLSQYRSRRCRPNPALSSTRAANSTWDYAWLYLIAPT